MIRTFRHKGLERFFRRSDARKIPADRAARIKRMLDRLDVAEVPGDMDLPGWGFHPLKGQMKGRYACSVSGNDRLTFAFDEKDAIEVDLEDYH